MTTAAAHEAEEARALGGSAGGVTGGTGEAVTRRNLLCSRREIPMMKSIAIALVIVLLGFLAWVAFQSSDISIIVNGQKLGAPANLAAEGWGLLVAVVALFCAAILLAFVFAGIGLIVLGALVLAGLVAAWFAFPFLLPLLIPLFIVWLFVAAVRSGGKSGA